MLPSFRKPALVTALFIVMLAGVAMAAAYGGSVIGPWTVPFYAKAGGFVGSGATSDTANRISTMKRCTLVYDFPSVAATGAGSACVDSAWGATCTGVVFGDQLLFGVDQVPPANLNAQLPTPYVSAADAVKVRVCNDSSDGGAIDWPDASYTILWIH